MAIKELVYAAKQQLESATQQSFRHSHIYELFAASFGFSTRASLDAAHVMAVMERTHLLDKIGMENIYSDTESAVADIITKVHTNTDLPEKGCNNCPLTKYIPV